MATTPRKTTSATRKSRTVGAGASRSVASRRTAEPDVDEVDVTPAEAQEIEAEGHYVTAELCGEEVQIVPASAWRSSWQRMLNQGNIDGFAEKIFHPDDYEFYLQIDPTVMEFIEFTQEAAARSGESRGNSRGPGTSSRRTRRR